nr:hypothetical protein [Nanoarchaeota archaeon]
MKKIMCFLLIILCSNIILAQETFNIEIELPETYKEIPAGEELWFTIKVINLANQDRMDITLKYDILNLNKYAVTSKSETVAVETQASFVGNIEIPDNLGNGLYSLRVTLVPVASSFKESQAETSFKIVTKAEKKQLKKSVYILIAGLLGLISLIYLIHKSQPLFKKLKMSSKVKRIIKKKHLK